MASKELKATEAYKAKNREAQRRYRERNREAIKEKMRKWHEAHPGKQAEHMRKWRESNRDRARQYAREYYHKHGNPYKQRDAKLRREFGITAEQYEVMFEQQRGVCAICGGVNASGMRLHVDHCHSSGKVRGLLCANCNLGLGNLKDSVEVMSRAIDYLRRSQ
jgi:hypothetical protein